MEAVLPGTVRSVADRYLRLLDSTAPGLVTGVYVVGSVALGEFRESMSDIDFVSLIDAPLTTEQLRALGRVHATLSREVRRPFFDGIYLTRKDIAGDPAQAGPTTAVQQHRFMTGSRIGLDPITWHTLSRCAVVVRGPSLATLDVWNVDPVLAEWTHSNVSTYWQPWLRRHGSQLSVAGLQALGSWATVWGVLGISRLAFTLATGDVTSKEGAGEYALTVMDPQWRPVIVEALRIRRGGAGRSPYHPFRRRRETLAFVDMMIGRIQLEQRA